MHADAEERAAQRITEAESGARVLRGQVAAEVARGQREAQDLLSKSRSEASQVTEEAAVESERTRERARTMLEEARSEVAALALRRDDIVRELGEVSGVIAALAVPTSRFGAPQPPGRDPATADDVQAGGAETDLSEPDGPPPSGEAVGEPAAGPQPDRPPDHQADQHNDHSEQHTDQQPPGDDHVSIRDLFRNNDG